MQYENIIKQMREYAEEYNIPIMTDEGMNYLLNFILKNHVKRVLEIGTAIGYSAIMMCSIDPELTVTTIERDEKRYLEALKNIKSAHLEDRIQLIYQDALEVSLEDEFDLLFIDAAKAQNQNFFERFEKNLSPRGSVITDNMSFHGMVDKKPEEIESRNVRQLVRKVNAYKEFLENHPRFHTDFYEIGDGLAVSERL